MSEETIQLGAAVVAGALLLASMLCAGFRIVHGPSGPDRVVALDLLSLLAVAATGLAVVVSESTAPIDIALGIALVGFLATVAFATFIERGSTPEERKQ
jgi:multicomponent Na+:H+ antiporter subunit F